MNIGKLNGDLLQPSGIRCEVRSFSVKHLISIAHWKRLISGVKLSVVVPQAIVISLHNSGFFPTHGSVAGTELRLKGVYVLASNPTRDRGVVWSKTTTFCWNRKSKSEAVDGKLVWHIYSWRSSWMVLLWFSYHFVWVAGEVRF